MNTNSDRSLVIEKTSSLSDLSERALTLYKNLLRDKLEPSEEGKGIAIHPDSGDYVVAQNPTYASRAMRLSNPSGSFVTMRIGPSPDFALASRILAGQMASRQNS